MPNYLVHSSRERARFRHPVFAREENRAQAIEILKKIKGIAGIKPGISSILIYTEPEANVPAICSELEKSFPELLVVEHEPQPAQSSNMVCRPKRLPQEQEKRKRELKTLLTAGIATVSLAAIGMHHLHAWAGGIFALLATHHVWERRGRL